MLGNNVNQAARIGNATGSVPDWASDAVRLCRDAVVRLDAVAQRLHRRLR